MNIDDVTIEFPEMSCRDLWREIVRKQKWLMEKYDRIERENGVIVPECNIITHRHTQIRIKDFFWRVTEELMEAKECIEPGLFINWEKMFKDSPEIRHFFEELADALHFMVEVTIISGQEILGAAEISEMMGHINRTHTKKNKRHNDNELIVRVNDEMMNVVYFLGLAANCLKNKPWKITPMATDDKQFIKYLMESWRHFFYIWADLNCTTLFMGSLYLKKSEVNVFRQRSNY